VVTFAGHAYPWDVLGDPGFADRVRDHGLGTVVLAAAYHSVRAATPMHPARRLVDAHQAALYRPFAPLPGPLQPVAATWLPEPDAFGTAAKALRDKGLRVEAWIVLTHNTRLGREFPELSVRNCFGERYAYALCPSWPEVRSYAAALTAAALQDVEVDGVSLEACGQLGIVHMGHHEKTDGAYPPDMQRNLSVCCCDACTAGWQSRGLDPSSVVADLRASRVPPDAVLHTRHASADALRTEVLAAIPHGLPVTLHAHPDPWATGASPGLTPSAALDVDSVLVPAWATAPATAGLVARAADIVGGSATVDAYLTVLPPADPDALVDHARRLVAAGAQRLSLYHLGLAAAERQPLFALLTGALA
jgi:hypothetical protein